MGADLPSFWAGRLQDLPGGDMMEKTSEEGNAVRHILIDTDTGSDDAVAIVMALHCPGVRVEACLLYTSRCV